MSLVSFDSKFGRKQQELARNGFVRKAGETVSKMSKEEYQRFVNSPAMNASEHFREVCNQRTSIRDKKRMQTDPSFHPRDEDWSAKKAFDFRPSIDYYRVLGVDEYEPLEGIKKAYKRLSLVYHPDKTAKMDEATAAEYQQIFIEIKNAYLVLGDHPTRRQYDKKRDDEVVANELWGQVSKKKAEAQFDAFKILEELAARKPKPSATVHIPVLTKLEKMFYGGIKTVSRMRTKQTLDSWVREEHYFKVVVPVGCRENYAVLRKGVGDHHQDRKPDHLNFRIRGKEHPRLVRDSCDLLLRLPVRLGAGASTDPYISAEVAGISGRVLLLFGRNPFAGLPLGTAAPHRLKVSVLGEGLGPKGRLRFEVELPVDSDQASSLEPRGSSGHRALKARKARRLAQPAECCAELGELRGALALGTSPHCMLHFYGNLSQPASVDRGSPVSSGGPQPLRVRPRPLFAVVLSCPLGAKGQFQKQWQQLRSRLMPLLWLNFWMLVPPMRAIQPRALDEFPAFAHGEEALDEGDVLESGEVKSGAEKATSAKAAPSKAVSPSARSKTRDPSEFLLRFKLGPPGGFIECRPRWAARPESTASSGSSCHTGRTRSRPHRAHHAEKLEDAATAESKLDKPPAELSDVALNMRLGDRAFHQGFYWLACKLYTSAASAAGMHDIPASLAPETANGDTTADQHSEGQRNEGEGDDGKVSAIVAAGATARARRADCLHQLRQFSTALDDARAATALLPRSGPAWRRLGVLEARLGDVDAAHSALLRAVELDARDEASVEMLQRLKVERPGDPGMAARSEKIAGNSSFADNPSKAVAYYTSGIALIQGLVEAAADAGGGGAASPEEAAASEEREDRTRLLAELLCNRAGALLRLRRWSAARQDAERALALPGRGSWATARLRLGAALLGEGRHEEAYPHLARASAGLPAGAPPEHPVRLGLASCLALAGAWSSLAARARGERRLRDVGRSRGQTRVFVVSDIHYDHPLAEEWVDRISNTKFQEDVLIVAGDVAESLGKLKMCLLHLRAKFRRVFFTPGNHDLWIHTSEHRQFTDSVHKFFGVLSMCDEIDVDVFPAALCQDLFVTPLFSWYNADFDLEDPIPTDRYFFDKYCKWPMDKHNELWRFMLYLNKHFLEVPCPGTVITFSHFLPRRELPFWAHVAGLAKSVGCPQLDEQLRQARSSCHIFGHSHIKCNAVIDGVRYIQSPLGYKDEHERDEPLMCIFDGSKGGLTAEQRSLNRPD